MGIKNIFVKTPPRFDRWKYVASMSRIAMTIGAGMICFQSEIILDQIPFLSGISALSSKAYAGDAEEAAKKAAERAQEEAKKQAERAREEAKKQAERASEEAKKQAERSREEAKKQAERSREEAKKQSENAREAAKKQSENLTEAAKKQSDHEDEHDRSDDHRRDEKSHEKFEYEDNLPPATVVELIKRLVKPKKKQQHKKPRLSESFSIGKATFKPREVLAANLSAGSIKRAKRLGFNVRKGARLSNLGIDVTRLIAPKGMDARRARRLLKRELPKSRFALNRLYRIHPAARDGPKNVPARATRLQHKGGRACMDDHCYGTSMMKWRPQLQSCAKRVRVGVIDTAIDYEHPAFHGGRVQMGNFVPGGRNPSSNWHGTGVLALLSGNPKTTTPGLIPETEFYVANVFSNDAAGNPVADSIGFLNALEWMDVFGVKVVNLSLSGPKDRLVEKAIARLSKKGVIFVAAAGNNGPSAPPSYPAAYKPVIAVTAINKKRRSYRYANRGQYIDVAAPGVDIWTAVPGRREGYRSGTSFAVPYVTAVIASLYRQNKRQSKSVLLKKLKIRDLGSPGKDQVYGRGLVLAPHRCQPVQNKPRSIAKTVLTR